MSEEMQVLNYWIHKLNKYTLDEFIKYYGSLPDGSLITGEVTNKGFKVKSFTIELEGYPYDFKVTLEIMRNGYGILRIRSIGYEEQTIIRNKLMKEIFKHYLNYLNEYRRVRMFSV